MGNFSIKQCNRCGEHKLLSEFVTDGRASDGRGGRCKECHRIACIESATKNSDGVPTPFISKACITCGAIKGIDGYMPRKGMRDGTRNECRKCLSARTMAGRKRIESMLTPDQIKERRRAYRMANVSVSARASRKQALRGYGLTSESFESLLKEQDDKCAICSTHLVSPQIDHCHSTGKVRGILCRKCNMGLGLFHDDVGSLQRAIAYLTQ